MALVSSGSYEKRIAKVMRTRDLSALPVYAPKYKISKPYFAMDDVVRRHPKSHKRRTSPSYRNRILTARASKTLQVPERTSNNSTKLPIPLPSSNQKPHKTPIDPQTFFQEQRNYTYPKTDGMNPMQLRPKDRDLEPMSEFEIKSDIHIQKSLQRTTMKAKTYPSETTTRPSTSWTASTEPQKMDITQDNDLTYAPIISSPTTPSPIFGLPNGLPQNGPVPGVASGSIPTFPTLPTMPTFGSIPTLPTMPTFATFAPPVLVGGQVKEEGRSGGFGGAPFQVPRPVVRGVETSRRQEPIRPPPAPMPIGDSRMKNVTSFHNSSIPRAYNSEISGPQFLRQTIHAPNQPRRLQNPYELPYEPLGCGFDYVSNSCKDLFSLGWCQSCEDFGLNPFVHDCRCTKPVKTSTSANPFTMPTLATNLAPIQAPQALVLPSGDPMRGIVTSQSQLVPPPPPLPVIQSVPRQIVKV